VHPDARGDAGDEGKEGGEDRSEEEPIEAADVAAKDTEGKEYEIAAGKDEIELSPDPGGEIMDGLPRVLAEVRAKPSDDLACDEQTGHVLVEAIIDGPLAFLQDVVGDEEWIWSMGGTIGRSVDDASDSRPVYIGETKPSGLAD
jgi:hypothetical protein